jgi:hypothetical protein
LVSRRLARQLYRSSPQFNHPYIYVSDNPLSWRDSMGLFGDGISAGGDYLGHSDFVGRDIFLNYLVPDRKPLAPSLCEGFGRSWWGEELLGGMRIVGESAEIRWV